MIGILTLLLLPSLFAISLLDVALRSVNYYKLSSVDRHGSKSAQKLFALISSPDRAISVLLFLRYTLTGCLFLLVGIFLHSLSWNVLYTVLLGAGVLLLLLLLLEYMPRMIATQNPERIAFTLLKPFELLLRLNRLIPLPQAMQRATSALLRVYGFNGRKIFSEYSVNEIKMFLSLRRSNREDGKRQAIGRKFSDFSQRRLREVMVPRPFVKAVEVNTSLKTVLRAFHESGYSRLPVYRSNFDNVLGILHVKDVIGAADPFSMEQHLRKPFFVPETATVQSAFQYMQRNRIHLALVVDEYGGVDGIVSLEDLIEELMGEIQDEYDREVQLLHRVSERVWMLEGNTAVKELNQNLQLDLPEASSYTTVAGFLLSVLDRIPNEKDHIRYGDLLFCVEKMVGYKIGKISLHLPHAPEPHLRQSEATH